LRWPRSCTRRADHEPERLAFGSPPWGEGVDVRPAYEALLEALANGSEDVADA
jgi:hypothetical protein